MVLSKLRKVIPPAPPGAVDSTQRLSKNHLKFFLQIKRMSLWYEGEKSFDFDTFYSAGELRRLEIFFQIPMIKEKVISKGKTSTNGIIIIIIIRNSKRTFLLRDEKQLVFIHYLQHTIVS